LRSVYWSYKKLARKKHQHDVVHQVESVLFGLVVGKDVDTLAVGVVATAVFIDVV
jgi:hypothetical protein